MKRDKRLIISIIIFILCIVLILFVNKKITKSAFTEVSNNRTIMIDPGHGGVDGGAVSKTGTVEKDVNLQISMKLKTALENLGFKVILTRDGDYGLYKEGQSIRSKKIEDLNNRSKLKSQSNCAIFISIHMNIFTETKYYGAQTWYSNNEESQIIAHIIQEGLKTDLDNENNRIEKPANNHYKLLRGDNIPSILVECGFLSNYEEEQKLLNEEYQDKIAISIANSINKYYEKD
ncbi:MAG: N-acetylmuramoyl-L-alanine amidase CwlD [Clostridiaceae bacterium]